MNDLLSVLRFLGYDEVRAADGSEWQAADEVNGRLRGATTDEVHVMVHDRWSPPCRLVDPSTGERVAVARSPESPEP